MSRVTFLGVLICLSLSVPSMATVDRENGATWYLKAMEEMKTLTRSEWDLIYLYERDRTIAPSQEVRNILAKAGPLMTLIRHGAEQDYVDYGLDRSNGLQVPLPHLAEVRKLTKLAQADAIVRLHDGDAAGAAERLAMVYRMAGQLSDDGMPISSYLGQYLIDSNDGLVGRAIDSALLDAPACAKLLNAVNSFDRSDPVGLAEAIAVQQEYMLTWLDAQMRDPATQADLVKVFHPIESDTDLLAPFATMDSETFAAEVEQCDAVMTRMMDAFGEADPEAAHAAIEALQEEISDGQHGPLALYLCEGTYLSVPLVEVYDSMCATREALEEGRGRLEKIAHGQVLVEEAADNAAVWYLRAIDLLERMEPAHLEVLRAVEVGSIVTLDDEISATLREADDVVELFRRGASIRRCDFSFVRETGPAFVPAYLPGVNDGLRLLHLDAIRLLDTERGAEGADRLALAFRVAVHLSEDESILSPLIAHTWFNHTFALTREAAGKELLNTEHYQVLAEAVDGMSRKDPFGYVGSARAGRNLASRRWLRRLPEHEREMREAIEYRIQHGSGDDLAFWLAAIDAVERCETGATGPQPDVSRLGDVLSPPALIELRRCVLSATTQEQRIELKLLEYDDGDHPAITSIADRSPKARSDLRACVSFLADRLADDGAASE